MNIFVRGTVETGAHVLHAKIKEDMKGDPGKWVTAWRFAELGEKEFMACMDIADMEAFGAFMSSPEEAQWDKDNGCEYTVTACRKWQSKRTIRFFQPQSIAGTREARHLCRVLSVAGGDISVLMLLRFLSPLSLTRAMCSEAKSPLI